MKKSKLLPDIRVPSAIRITQMEHCFARIAYIYGTKRYRKDRVRCERITQKLLEHYGLKGTCIEKYYYLQGFNILLGNNKVWMHKAEIKHMERKRRERRRRLHEQ